MLMPECLRDGIYRGAWKLLDSSLFLYKYDLKRHQTFTQLLKEDKRNPIKQKGSTNIHTSSDSFSRSDTFIIITDLWEKSLI